MKELYTTLFKQLSNIKSIKYIDIDTGQLMEEQPPIAYPCALINIDLNHCEDLGDKQQHCQAHISIKVITKSLTHTNINALNNYPNPKAFEWLSISEEVYKTLQGYEDENFYSFSRTGQKNSPIRKGLNIVVMNFETSFRDYTASS